MVYTERDLIFRIGTILRPRSVYCVALAQPDTHIPHIRLAEGRQALQERKYKG